MLTTEEKTADGRKRLTQVFRYLEALNHHRNPAKRHLDDQLWRLWFRELPDHPAIRIATPDELGITSASENATSTSGAAVARADSVLKVRRPKLTACPAPPELLLPWLERGWQEAVPEVRLKPTRNEFDKEGRTALVRFEEDEARPRAFERWRMQRETWLTAERPARDTMRVFEQLYEIRGQIEREGEKLELVLGDGILSWKREDGGVYHPILLQRVQLEFDPTVPEFSIVESERPVEFYSALFQSMPDVEGKVLARIRQELEEGKFHPLGREDTSGLLRSLVVQLSPRGEFYADSAPKAQNENPVMGRSPVILLRNRTLGFAVAIQSVLEDLAAKVDIPTSLLRIVGIEQSVSPTTEESDHRQTQSVQATDVLLSKPANPEQVRMAARLDQHGSVLVQGPPGTGKTHTIANLIGHLLAEGKSILVTSHTSKALRIVRDQVVSQLRPLCVSVLDSDVESRKQLESSVDEIVSRLSRNNASELGHLANDLGQKRSALVRSRDEVAQALLNARADEYREMVIAGEAFSPSEAARRVCDGAGSVNYIPPPVKFGCDLPLNESEIAELYRTNETVPVVDEMELAGQLPNPERMLSPVEFDKLCSERAELSMQEFTHRTDLWTCAPVPDQLDALDILSDRTRRTAKYVESCNGWQHAAMLAGYYGGDSRKPWENLLAQLDETWSAASRAQDCLLQYDPELPSNLPIDDAIEISGAILSHLQRGGQISFLVLLTRANWKTFIRTSRVGNVQPNRIEHFDALHSFADLTMRRTQLAARWAKQMVPLGASASDAEGPAPEQKLHQYAPAIRKSLGWYGSDWEPLEADAVKVGLRFRQLLEEQPADVSSGELNRLAAFISGPLQQVLAARRNLIRWNAIEQKASEIRASLQVSGGDTQSTAVVERLINAVNTFDARAYREALGRLNDLFARRKDLQRRRELLTVLDSCASGWADAIRKRAGVHGQAVPPLKIHDAWLWRQFNDELDRRAKVSIEELQQRSERIDRDIRSVTSDLIERKAWAAQLARTERNLNQKQALVGWLDTIRKIGKGTGIRVPKLKTQANRLMTECRAAVPVWIMPLSRVAENFDPRTTRFDVVIIDEASQADVMALLALYLADKAVVVGDHEQVSPVAVGQDLGIVEHLIDEFLENIPNRHLYDEKTSLYDLARQSFGGTIRLVEHFRCVPEIIQFSNHLSYEGAIRPLRDPSKVSLKPHVISHRVNGAFSRGKVNDEEAEEIAALVVAVSQEPEYAGKTFGIISLVGDEQAYKIDLLLRKQLSEEEFKLQHNILCGNPAQFQGDERDVVFLSIVDTSDGDVLRIREEPMFKQRFNVAASRARDQMWVVHSIDPRSHLKPGDLRRRLIEYSEDPYQIMRTLESVEARAESPFERDVAGRLVRMGYRVHPQWRVGHYRIDLVVEGGGKRVAIECDGDKFHPIDRLADDMARQAVLERLGWTFVRIRGSQFFRQPDDAIETVIRKLRYVGIEPEAENGTESEECELDGRDLLERVRRRAAELRRQWGESNGGPAASVNRSFGTVDVRVSTAPLDPEENADTSDLDDGIDAEEFSLSGSSVRLLTRDVNAEAIRAAIASNIPGSDRVEREVFLRQCAQTLGFSRLSKKLRSRLNKTIGAEVRYGRIHVDADWRYLWK